MKFIPTSEQQGIIQNFENERYDYLNQLRWDLFLRMEIPVKEKVIFEPGAGIGDQTEWLLNRGAKHIYVNDGRPENLQIIRQRFEGNPRLTFVPGNLEDCLDKPEFNFSVDLVFLWGVYYHISDSLSEFNIMKALSKIGPVVVFDYLEGNDEIAHYGYDNPSTSLSQNAIRPTTKTLMEGLKKTWGHAYLPKMQIDWEDPLAKDTPRKLAVASREPLLDLNDRLIEQ